MSSEPREDAPPATLLKVRGLEAGWDRSLAVRGADLDASSGEIVAILGGNGSGKSSLLWAIAGLLRPRAGTVAAFGRRIDGLGAERIARMGLSLLPQTRRVFSSMTVRENLEVTNLAPGRPTSPPPLRARVDEWLDRFPALDARLDEPAGSLSGGEQQLVAIGRVMSSSPRILLLDEPSAGLSKGWAAECGRAFVDLASRGAAVVLVEQNVNLAHHLATRTLHMRLGHLTNT